VGARRQPLPGSASRQDRLRNGDRCLQERIKDPRQLAVMVISVGLPGRCPARRQ
jgi:hypothetical protein